MGDAPVGVVELRGRDAGGVEGGRRIDAHRAQVLEHRPYGTDRHCWGDLGGLHAAARILAEVDAGTRELVVAEGAEAAIAALRRSDPDALFDRMSAMVRAGYAQQMKAGRAD